MNIYSNRFRLFEAYKYERKKRYNKKRVIVIEKITSPNYVSFKEKNNCCVIL
jgi:hypothetical protein